MKKKVLIVIAVLLAVFIAGITAGTLLINSLTLGIHTGVVLKSDNGTCFLVSHNSPIRLCDYSQEGRQYDHLSDGDKILVFHNGINESYPASTFSYLTIKLDDGSIEDVPQGVIDSLTQLGWIENTDYTGGLDFSSEPVRLGDENANFSISIPEGWSFEKTEASPLAPVQGFGISIYHNSSPERTVTVEFTESFGVCGTGLRTEDVEIGGYKACKGIYDGSPSFSYIVFEDTPGFYVIHNNTDGEWWAQHKNEITQILGTLKIADSIIFHDEALEIAKADARGEYIAEYNEYSAEDGIWSFTFEAEETTQIIKIGKNGQIIS